MEFRRFWMLTQSDTVKTMLQRLNAELKAAKKSIQFCVANEGSSYCRTVIPVPCDAPSRFPVKRFFVTLPEDVQEWVTSHTSRSKRLACTNCSPMAEITRPALCAAPFPSIAPE